MRDIVIVNKNGSLHKKMKKKKKLKSTFYCVDTKSLLLKQCWSQGQFYW